VRSKTGGFLERGIGVAEVWVHRAAAAFSSGGLAASAKRASAGRYFEYLMIAAGGHNGFGTRTGDYIVACALP
jgi:glucose dehydrogenase